MIFTRRLIGLLARLRLCGVKEFVFKGWSPRRRWRPVAASVSQKPTGPGEHKEPH